MDKNFPHICLFVAYSLFGSGFPHVHFSFHIQFLVQVFLHVYFIYIGLGFS